MCCVSIRIAIIISDKCTMTMLDLRQHHHVELHTLHKYIVYTVYYIEVY